MVIQDCISVIKEEAEVTVIGETEQTAFVDDRDEYMDVEGEVFDTKGEWKDIGDLFIGIGDGVV